MTIYRSHVLILCGTFINAKLDCSAMEGGE